MSGVCGWIATGTVADAETARAMGRALGRADEARLQAESCGPAAIAAAHTGGTGCALRRGAVLFAICGHPRWRSEREATSELAAVAGLVVDEYARRGTAALQQLEGDFAFALVDTEREEVLLAVDRIGIRNLIWQSVPGGVVFGSSADALAPFPASNREVDPQGIYDYVYFHMIPGPTTAFVGQERLLPGHYLHWRRGTTDCRPYWQMHFSEDSRDGVAAFKPSFISAMKCGVADASAGAECGSFLSGGTDSSTVAGLLRDVTGKPARTYSIGFDAAGFDEMEYARLAARHFGTLHHEYYVTPDDVVDAIPLIAEAYDQPFGNASAVPTYFCARLARNDGITRLLGGDGGDELFGGNARYAKQYQLGLYDNIPLALRRGLIEAAVFRVPGGHRIPLIRKARSYIHQASMPMPARYESYNLLERLGAANVFAADFLAGVDCGHPHTLLKRTYDAADARSLINRMLALDIKFTLADNDLPKVTRMCELAGIDVTFPLLHEAVVDFSSLLPPQLKLKGTRLRYFFKEALRDYLPDEIITKQKHGFGLPVGAWLTTHSRLRELAGDSLQSLKARQVIRSDFIDGLFGSRVKTHAEYYGTMIWILMMLELWFQKHTTRR